MKDLEERLDAIPIRYVELSFGRLAYRDSGEGTAIVFLHGIGSGSASWVLQFEELAKDYHCIAWDAPGYGDSDAFNIENPEVSDYVGVLREWIDQVGIENYHLVGHSLGALTVGAHCQPGTRLPLSITYIDPTLGFGGRSKSERCEMIEKRLRSFDELGPERLASDRAPALLAANASKEAHDIVHWSMSRLRSTGHRHAVNMLAQTDLLAMVGVIETPVTVLCGTADTITPEDLSQRLVLACRNASYIPIEGSGHAAYADGADEVNRHLREVFELAVTTNGSSCRQLGG